MGRRGWIGNDVLEASWAISALGVVFVGVTSAYVVTYFAGVLQQSWGQPTPGIALRSVAVALILVFSIGITYAGYRLSQSDFSNEQRWWVMFWTTMGLSGTLAVVVLVQTNQALSGPGISQQTMIEQTLIGASGGAVGGLLVGLTNARLRRQREETVAQRDTFRFLNQLLRHHILNGIQEIQGYSGFLHDADPDELEHIVSRIEDRTNHMTHVVQDLQTLINSTAGETEFRPVNISKILEQEIESAAIRYPDAEFETNISENAHVKADEFIRTAYRNLLSDIVERSDQETPHVVVSMEMTPEVVIINIADNSSEISPTYHEQLSGDPDLSDWDADQEPGLNLALRLIELYGGRVQTLETNPHGTVLRTRLSRP